MVNSSSFPTQKRESDPEAQDSPEHTVENKCRKLLNLWELLKLHACLFSKIHSLLSFIKQLSKGRQNIASSDYLLRYIPAIDLLHQNVAFLLCHLTGWKLQRKTKNHFVIKLKRATQTSTIVVPHFVDRAMTNQNNNVESNKIPNTNPWYWFSSESSCSKMFVSISMILWKSVFRH